MSATADASHNSRWGNVKGWRRTLPLLSHSLRAARLFSGIGVLSSIRVLGNRQRHQPPARHRAILQFARRKELPSLPLLWTPIPALSFAPDLARLLRPPSLHPFALQAA